MPKFPCRTALAGVLCLVALPVLADFQTLDGTVAYRARIALPPEAMVEVRLVDISRADAPSITLGAVTVRPGGQVPIPWRLTYDDAMIAPGHRFAVQAEITLKDETLFRTTRVFSALGEGDPDKVDVVVEMMPQAVPAPLAGTSWIATEVPGATLDGARPAQVRFGPEGQVSGTSGCNRFTGAFETGQGGLKLGPLASTRMACIGDLDAQERAVFQALGNVAGYEVEGDMLILRDASGATVMRLTRG